jgi:D-xylose transport system substrate-binding protein
MQMCARYVVLVLVLAGFLAALPGCVRKDSPQNGPIESRVRIGLLMETYDLDRWKRDEMMFTARVRAMQGDVSHAVADGDQDRQNKQADALLTQGMSALVVIPKNLFTAARIVKSAHEKGVPVLAYDRLIRDADLDVYVTFDNERVGYLQAQGVLDKIQEGNVILLGGAASDNNAKLLRDGQRRAIEEYVARTGRRITVLADPFMDDWDRDEARRRTGSLLTRSKAEGKRVDGIIASNDATAGGVVAALKAEKLEGKVAVSGQDAELQACQRIVEGTQTMTVYKPVRKIAEVSAEVAVRLARKERPEDIVRSMGYTVNYLDNGFKKVPTVLLEPINVNKDNMVETVIKDGWHSLDKVYADIPRSQWPREQ